MPSYAFSASLEAFCTRSREISLVPSLHRASTDALIVHTTKYSWFKDPRWVGVAPNDDIYVCDQDARCLFHFSPEGNLLRTVRDSQTPRAVSIIDSQLFLVFSNSLKIFDLKFNLVGNIENKTSDDFDDVVK